MTVRILQGDCRSLLATLPAESVHCCVTSPPYFGLRDYGTATWGGGDPGCDHTGVRRGHAANEKQATSAGTSRDRIRGEDCRKCGATRTDSQIGLEQTPEAYVAELVAVFREVRRVLRDDGTLWLNLGDSYANLNHAPGSKQDNARVGGNSADRWGGIAPNSGKIPPGLKAKDLIGIPWRVAFALQADGWVLRQEIIWAKPNPMPESVTDRCTKSHESLFLFAKASWNGPAPGRFGHISDADARWLALLIDAEGCLVVKRNQHEGRADTFAPQVSIGNTSEALMREVVRIVGHGNLLEREGKNCRMLYWQLANGLARDLLHRLYPWFIVKQRQVRIGIHVDALTYYRGGKTPERKNRDQKTTDRLLSLWARNKECNSFGQPDLSDVPEPEIGRWGAGPTYFCDMAAIAEPVAPGNEGATLGLYGSRAGAMSRTASGNEGRHIYDQPLRPDTRNKRSVWTVTTQPFAEAHFATFPPALIVDCIKAGCPEGGVVLDPFGGAGTTGLVADRLQRDAILIELNPAYAAMARRRITGDAPLFAEVAA